MKRKGTLDGTPITIYYDTNGFEFYDISIQISFVHFEWDDLSPLQQVQILQQLEQSLPKAEENYN